MRFWKGDFNFIMSISDICFFKNKPYTHGVKQMEAEKALG